MNQVNGHSKHNGCCEPTAGGRTFRPKVDIVERQDMLVMHAELPGVAVEDVHLEVKKGRLELRAQRKQAEQHDRQLLKGEFVHGNFERSFELAETMDTDRIEARFKDGILTLQIPKAEAAKPRTINVLQA